MRILEVTYSFFLICLLAALVNDNYTTNHFASGPPPFGFHSFGLQLDQKDLVVSNLETLDITNLEEFSCSEKIRILAFSDQLSVENRNFLFLKRYTNFQ